MPSLFPAPSSPAPKVNITTGSLPSYVSAGQAPTKKSPWRTIREVEFHQSVTVMLPDELYQVIWKDCEAAIPKGRYAKVMMKLEEVLQGEFFNEYIKKGNILMLSEGSPGVDDMISLQDGILKLQLSKDTYERAGLQGSPIPSGGRKHVKSYYEVTLNLRLPSMLHGKKGFERLVWASKNVLNHNLVWLFADLNNPEDISAPPSGPIMAYHPTIHALAPSTTILSNVSVPNLLMTTISSLRSPSPTEEIQESIYELLEYLDMLALASPRLQITDQVDPFISQYTVPGVQEGSDSDLLDDIGQRLMVLKWSGLLSIQWVLGLICSIIKHSRTNDLQGLSERQPWLALTVSGHKTQAVGQIDGCTILLRPGNTSENLGSDEHDDKKNNDSEDQQAVKNGHERTSDDDVPMADSHSETEPPQQPLSSTIPRNGIQRYLCAEYVDSLT